MVPARLWCGDSCIKLVCFVSVEVVEEEKRLQSLGGVRESKSQMVVATWVSSSSNTTSIRA